MAGNDRRALTLSIVRETGCLKVALSDGRALARLGTVDLDEARRVALSAPGSRLSARDLPAVPHTDPWADLVQRGQAFAGQVFPPAVRDALAQARPGVMHLQLSDSLLAMPWELAHDGQRFLGAKFSLARQVLTDEPYAPAACPSTEALGRKSLKVLVVVGDAQAQGARAQGLVAALDTVGVTVTLSGTRAYDRGALLEAMLDHDVLHCVVPAEPEAPSEPWWQGPAAFTTGDIAALPYPPALLVAQCSGGQGSSEAQSAARSRLMRQLYRTGLNVLGCEGREELLPTLAQFYASLARGGALADALRAQRQASPMALHGGLVLYGDAAHVIRPQQGARAGGEVDHLRQLTIMSYDLAESTRLLTSLGVERYSEVLSRYHQRCAAIIARHGGVSDDPQGDGNMCFFGFPVADEEAGLKSVRAGLQIVETVQQLGLKVRVGIATGQVAVRAGHPVGVTAHLASRLQSVAAPGSVLISASTQSLLRERFLLEPLAQVPQLKGIDGPGKVYRVLAPAPEGRDKSIAEALSAHPFVGRDAEFQMLEQHWQDACSGAAQCVLVSGDAGIGKSRLVREFRRTLRARGQLTAECRCTTGHVHSAFHAVTEMVQRRLGFRPEDTADERLDKIQREVASDVIGEHAVPLMASLLGVPTGSRCKPLDLSAERQRQLTLNMMAAWFRQEMLSGPHCVIIEDFQWIDPSTRELVQRLVAETASLPLLVLITQRSEGQGGKAPSFPVHRLDLKGLSEDGSRALVMGACGNQSVPGDLVQALARRGDGVPLFIEESTRMALDLMAEAPAGAVPIEALSAMIPGTLNDLLTARLDRLGDAKSIAQVGATLGREFSYELLEAVLAHDSAPVHWSDLGATLDELVRSGLVVERGERPHSSLLFKHALVRDSAYQSLWERDRKRLHGTVAGVITRRFPDLAETHPEVLAHHSTQAGQFAEAVAHWERAARRAIARSAHDEAISHLGCGLDLLGRLPPSEERDRTELRMQVLMASRLIVTQGYGADQVERTYARASELCELLKDEATLMRIGLGLEGYHFMRGHFRRAQEIATNALAQALRSNNPLREMQARWAVANVLFHQGQVSDAVLQMESCLPELKSIPRRGAVLQDPAVMCLCYSAWGRWELGQPDQALAHVREVVTLARAMQHPFSICEAYGFRTTIHHFRGENEAALVWADRAIEVAREGGFVVWLAHAKLMRGRVLVDLGEMSEGIDQMRQGYEMWAGTGAVVTRPFHLALQAEGLALSGRPDGGLALLEIALQLVRQYGEKYYEAEIRRLFGELTLQSGALAGENKDAEALSWLQGSLELSEATKLHGFSLRSATSLARLYLGQGRSEEAISTLERAYTRITEGSRTRDVEKARVLLEALRPVGRGRSRHSPPRGAELPTESIHSGKS